MSSFFLFESLPWSRSPKRQTIGIDRDIAYRKVMASGTVCGSNRYFRTNNLKEGRTMGRTNLSKNGFSEALNTHNKLQ